MDTKSLFRYSLPLLGSNDHVKESMSKDVKQVTTWFCTYENLSNWLQSGLHHSVAMSPLWQANKLALVLPAIFKIFILGTIGTLECAYFSFNKCPNSVTTPTYAILVGT
jgi:hypothetical protein